MKVPFVDLSRSHSDLTGAFQEALSGIVTRSEFVNGPAVAKFEKEFADFVGTQYCLGFSSGLDAETVGLRACGVKNGDRVAAPAMTFIATIEAIHYAGGNAELIDIDDSGLIDLKQLEELFQEGVKYVVPVHLFGQMVNPSALKSLAEKYGVTIFEDACQAHGASQDGIRVGTIGKAAAFSFYPGKNLGALGDGGALCTNDYEVYLTAKALREHGQTSKNVFTFEGYTARLDTLQAAFLSIKLPKLRQWTEERIEIGKKYAAGLAGLPNIRLQFDPETHGNGSHVCHLLVAMTEHRTELAEALSKSEIGFGFHYPVPIHKMPVYQKKSWASKKFAKAEQFAHEGISLPIFPGMTDAEISYVTTKIREFFKDKS